MNPKDQIHYDIAELLEKIAHLNIKLASTAKIHPVELDLLRSYLRELDKLADSMPLMQLPKPSFAIPQQPEAQQSNLPSFNTPEEAPVESTTQSTTEVGPAAAVQGQAPLQEAIESETIPEEQAPEATTEQEPTPQTDTNTWQWEREGEPADAITTQTAEDEPEQEITLHEANDTIEDEEPAKEQLAEDDEEVLVDEAADQEDDFVFEEEEKVETETELVLDEDLEPTEQVTDEPGEESTENEVAETPQPEKPRFQWELPDKPVATETEPANTENNETTEHETETQPENEQEAPAYPLWADAPTEEPVAETTEIENPPQEDTSIEETPTAAHESYPQDETIEPAVAQQTTEQAVPADEPAKPRSLNDLFNKGESQDLGSRFQFQNRKNLREMIDLSERYVFTKELFGGDADYYDRAIRQLNQFETLAEAQQYLRTDLRVKYNWETKEQVEIQFTRIVERRFA